MCIQFATAKEKHSVVITDPKAELFKTTGKIFENNGYEIVTIDFREPTKSNKINIMQPIIDEWKEHCVFNKYMMFLLSYFVKRNKISLNKMFSTEKYLFQIMDKFKLEDYIVETLKNNQEDLDKLMKNKKIYNEIEFENYSNDELKIFLNNLSYEELLNKIKYYQNESVRMFITDFMATKKIIEEARRLANPNAYNAYQMVSNAYNDEMTSMNQQQSNTMGKEMTLTRTKPEFGGYSEFDKNVDYLEYVRKIKK